MECHNCKYYKASQYENECKLLEEQYFTPFYGDNKCPVVEENGSVAIDKYEEWFKYK